MAKRRSMFRRLVVLGVFCLAAFGGWTLYKSHQDTVNSMAKQTSEKAKAVKDALTE